MIRSLIHTLKERQFRGMRRQTAKLDPQLKDHLREFLEDVPAEVDDLQHLETQLEEAHGRLVQLLEKEAFLDKRIASYRAQLQKFQEKQQQQQQQQQPGDTTPTTPTMTDEQRKAQQEKYEAHVTTLKEIEASHKIMQRTIEVLEERIEIMEQRHVELKRITEECHVVYEATTTETISGTAGNDVTVSDSSQEKVESVADDAHPSGTSLDVDEEGEWHGKEENNVDEEIGQIELSSQQHPIP